MAWEVVVVDELAQITTSLGEYSDYNTALIESGIAQADIDEEDHDLVYAEVREIK